MVIMMMKYYQHLPEPENILVRLEHSMSTRTTDMMMMMVMIMMMIIVRIVVRMVVML